MEQKPQPAESEKSSLTVRFLYVQASVTRLHSHVSAFVVWFQVGTQNGLASTRQTPESATTNDASGMSQPTSLEVAQDDDQPQVTSNNSDAPPTSSTHQDKVASRGVFQSTVGTSTGHGQEKSESAVSIPDCAFQSGPY